MDRPGGLSRHVPELDGVRGIAVLLVLLFHFSRFWPRQSTWPDSTVQSFLDFGWVGVDLFFALSGCLITGILLESRGLAQYFRSFYIRRALRILPLYYGMVIAFFWLAPGVAAARHIHWPEFDSTEQIWYWLHIANWHTAFFPFSYPHLSHLWSLGVEEQFYVLWPLVVLVCRERTLLYVCCGLAVVSCGLRNIPEFQTINLTYSNFLYRITPFRMEPLVLGACIPLLMRSEKWIMLASRWVGPAFWTAFALTGLLVLLGGPGPIAFTSLMTRFGYSTIALASACFVLWAVLQAGSGRFSARLFRQPALARLGKYSYAMYMIHNSLALYWPGQVKKYLPFLGDGLGCLFFTIATGSAVTYVLAILSWKVIEQPFLNLKERFSYGKKMAPLLSQDDSVSAGGRGWRG